jgi:hypothetical protein
MQTTKRTRREIRELAAKAEELELRAALRPLADDFKRWEIGEIDSFDLKNLIHRFHQGPARDIYVHYDTNHPEPQVAGAIASGLLDRATISAEVLTALGPWMEFILSREREQDEPPERPAEAQPQSPIH